MPDSDRSLGRGGKRTGVVLRRATPLSVKSSGYGHPEITTGGQVPEYYTSVRIDVRRIGPYKSDDGVIGNRTRVEVVKNRLDQ